MTPDKTDKIVRPPDLTEEDEKLLNKIWEGMKGKIPVTPEEADKDKKVEDDGG